MAGATALLGAIAPIIGALASFASKPSTPSAPSAAPVPPPPAAPIATAATDPNQAVDVQAQQAQDLKRGQAATAMALQNGNTSLMGANSVGSQTDIQQKTLLGS